MTDYFDRSFDENDYPLDPPFNRSSLLVPRNVVESWWEKTKPRGKKMGEMADMAIANMLGEDPIFGDYDNSGHGRQSFDPLRYYTHVRFIKVVRQTKKAVRFEFEPGVEGWMPKGVIKDFKLEKQSMHVQKDFWKTKREELGIMRGGGLTDEKQGELKMVADNRKAIDAIMAEGQQEKFEFVDLQGKP